MAFVEQTSVVMVLMPWVLPDAARHGTQPVIDAKFEKLALRAWLCLEDALEVVDRQKLDGFATRK